MKRTLITLSALSLLIAPAANAASDYEPPVYGPPDTPVVELSPPKLLMPLNRAKVKSTWQYDGDSDEYQALASVKFRIRSIPNAADRYSDATLYMEMSEEPYLDPDDGLFVDPYIISWYGDDLFWDFIETLPGKYVSSDVQLEPGVYYWHSIIANDCDYFIVGDDCQYKVSGTRKLIVRGPKRRPPMYDE